METPGRRHRAVQTLKAALTRDPCGLINALLSVTKRNCSQTKEASSSLQSPMQMSRYELRAELEPLKSPGSAKWGAYAASSKAQHTCCLIRAPVLTGSQTRNMGRGKYVTRQTYNHMHQGWKIELLHKDDVRVHDFGDFTWSAWARTDPRHWHWSQQRRPVVALNLGVESAFVTKQSGPGRSYQRVKWRHSGGAFCYTCPLTVAAPWKPI